MARWTQQDIDSKKKPSKPHQSEDSLQKSCVTWFNMQYRQYAGRLWHPANGGSRNVIEATKLKAMGVLSGVCDLILSVPNFAMGYGGMFIELKVGKNKTTENQDRFIAAHKDDYMCIVCYSLEDFIVRVNMYLSTK